MSSYAFNLLHKMHLNGCGNVENDIPNVLPFLCTVW